MVDHVDLLVVGGGVNGAAIARDAAGRGARVMLVEQDDLASHTSSASTKLIHGGLRYLEHFEFRLVAEALAERERLMAAAPHLIRPLRFVLPLDRRMRPGWMIGLGLFLYDRLGGPRTLPKSASLDLRRSPFGDGLQPRFRRGYVYSDCWGDDSRLVVANAIDACERGATVHTRCRLLSARCEGAAWTASILDRRTGSSRTVRTGFLVNATGSWAGRVLSAALQLNASAPLRLVRGSHIVTRRLFRGDHAYVLQNPDRRIVFVIPYEQVYTLIGTTDVAWDGEPDQVGADPAEVAYLCETVNRCLAEQISPEDVIWSYAGLRPLYDDEADDPSAISRDYVLQVNGRGGEGEAPVLTVFGGKITTHRVLAESAMDLLAPRLPGLGAAWTRNARLPGGDIPSRDIEGFVSELEREAGFAPRALLRRWAMAYGSRTLRLLAGIRSMADLGEHFGAGLTEAEVAYLRQHEWALTADDILWRRSKLGLHMPAGGAARLREYLAEAPRQPQDQQHTTV